MKNVWNPEVWKHFEVWWDGAHLCERLFQLCVHLRVLRLRPLCGESHQL